MTTRNTPDRAFRAYLDPLEQALGCIVVERLSPMRSRPIDVGQVYSILLNDNEPVALKTGNITLNLFVGQQCRIVEDGDQGDKLFRVQTVSYWYVLTSVNGREILAFHWTPESDPSKMKTTPHLHVGSVNISASAPLAPKTFNKLHIPTGQVSIQAVVRFLIEEAGVEPRRADWSEILDQVQAHRESR